MALINTVQTQGAPVASATASQSANLLGNLVFMSIGELKVDKKDLESLFQKEGLSLSKFQPGDIRPADAMRRATSTLRNKKIPVQYAGNNKNAVIDITESVTPDITARYVGRKVVDDKGKKVQYDQISTVIFDKKQNTLTYTSIDPSFLQEFPYDQMLDSVVDLYQEWCQYHTKDTVRNIMNKVVASLMPTFVKPSPDEDSVAKFIPATHKTELYAMKKVVDGLRPHHLNGASSGVQFIELFDSEVNKDMLEQSVKGDIQGRVSSLIKEMTDTLQQKGSITLDKGKSLITQLNQMKAEAEHYASLLNTSMDILDKQVQTALMRVDDAMNANTVNPYLRGS